MCGIVSLVYRDETTGMGREATELLKRLEYRGYDSTGAGFIGKDKSIVVAKKVGAPSVVTRELSIPSYKGQRFIGQVRWATYGAVDYANSQPHHVHCKLELLGAHNGNISNTDTLKAELTRRGHRVVSDNDGEIIVHLAEHHYAANLAHPGEVIARGKAAAQEAGIQDIPDGVVLMADAIRKAEAEAEGSYAAAVADPQLAGCFAIKSGSSLYAGLGEDGDGSFIVVSSDLSSVLAKTRQLIPLSEGEGLWYTHDRYIVFTLDGELRFSQPALRRSRLNVRDTGLDPRYKHYMEQEIRSSPANLDEVARYYFDDRTTEPVCDVFNLRKDAVKAVMEEAGTMMSGKLQDAPAALQALMESQAFHAINDALSKAPSALAIIASHGSSYYSDDAALLTELSRAVPGHSRTLAVLDMAAVWLKRRQIMKRTRHLVDMIQEVHGAGGKVYLLASGTSYHAALIAAYFFDGLATIPLYPCNPGLFRGSYINSINDRDMIIAISQSGETKDLVDILQDAKDAKPGIRRVALVNNENSRIPQELSDFYLPLLCGPETAVAATKSFMSQLAVLYVLASAFSQDAGKTRDHLAQAATLINRTLSESAQSIDKAAAMLAQRPSIHILGTGLIGLAKEGALKIREVALNHSEGYDSAEFKHGPNTILGKNTVFGLEDIEKAVEAALSAGAAKDTSGTEYFRTHPDALEALFSNYPLVFVCPPDDRDARITISQIHTHKIRGADIILFAEKRADLEAAVVGAPAGDDRYRYATVWLPDCADRFLFVFSAAAALQYLAYRMSVIKMTKLDKLGVKGHGVHPDAPKNVSKSITVD